MAPWLVSTGAQLAYFAWEVNNGTTYAGEYVTLTGDIDLGGREWTAIGTDFSHPFKGSFDGAGHAVSNLFINKPDTDMQGLFGCLIGAEIKNLGLENVNVTGKGWVGGIAGYVRGGSNIADSYSTGNVSGTDYYVGGIAGYIGGTSDINSIKNSYSTGTVSGNDYVGGIAGHVGGTSGNNGVVNCYSTGNVSGNTSVGGIAGRVGSTSGSASVVSCYSTGNVSGTGYYVGGVAGRVGATNGSDSVENSYSTGTVNGNDYVGGIAGYVGATSGSASVVNCAALNPWVRATASYAGRVVGSSGSTGTGNVAWDGIETGGGAAFTGNAGTGITKTAIQNGSGFPFNVTAAPWSYPTTGILPTLIGLAGQNNALPAHLQ
ncbi:MAG: hypothetical protein LBI67_02595 [Treponema sp.]|nr:hypothetical protein [Treponema sp.]